VEDVQNCFSEKCPLVADWLERLACKAKSIG